MKFGIVRQFGPDHLDRHLTADRRLISPIHIAERTLADLLAQLVTAHGQTRLRPAVERPRGLELAQRRVVEHDPLFQLGEFGRGIETQLLAQPSAQRAERSQCVALATCPIQRQHQVRRQSLSQRMLADQALELTDQLACPARPQIGIDAVLDRCHPQLVQPSDLGLGERLERELLQGATTPQRQRLTEHQRRRRRIGVEQRPALPSQRLEPDRIDVLGNDVQDVTGRPGDQHRAVAALGAIGLERRAQARDVDPQRVLAILPRVAGPQFVDQLIGRHDPVGVDQQHRQSAPAA